MKLSLISHKVIVLSVLMLYALPLIFFGACTDTKVPVTHQAYIWYICPASPVEINDTVKIEVYITHPIIGRDENDEPIFMADKEDLPSGFAWTYQWIEGGETSDPIVVGLLEWEDASWEGEEVFKASIEISWDRAGSVVVNLKEPTDLTPPYSFEVLEERGSSLCIIKIITEEGVPTDNAPKLNAINDKYINEGQLFEFTVSATYYGDDLLTYLASNLPPGASFNSETQVFSWMPANGQAGTYRNVHFEVSDAKITDSDDITIIVTEKLTAILEYRFEEGQGNTLSNIGSFAAIQGAHGTLVGPEFSNDTPPGVDSEHSLFFDGYDDFVYILDDFDYTDDGDPSSEALEQLTVEAWVKPTTLGPGSSQTVIWDDYGGPGVILSIHPNGNVQFSISTVKNTELSVTVWGGRITANKWYHIAGVYNGNTLRVFINGQDTCFIAETSGGIRDNSTVRPGQADIAIGAENSVTSTLNFNGFIDELRIYNVALKQHQLARGFFANRPQLQCMRLTATSLIGIPPGRLALTPDQHNLYVVHSGPGGLNNEGSISVVDTTSNSVVTTIEDLGEGFPFQITISPDGNRGYVAISKASGDVVTSGANRVVVINTDPESPTYHDIVAEIEIPGISDFGSWAVSVTPDGARVYVNHRGDDAVHAIDTEKNIVVESINNVGTGPAWLAITPDSDRVYIVNRRDSTVVVIDIGSEPNKLLSQIRLNIGPSNTLAFITITPDGTRAYVTYAEDPNIAILNTDPLSPNYNKQIGSIQTTASVLGRITIAPDGKRALVPSDTDYLLVIDTDPESDTYNTQIGLVPVGSNTSDVVYANFRRVVAYASGGDTIWVIEELP